MKSIHKKILSLTQKKKKTFLITSSGVSRIISYRILRFGEMSEFSVYSRKKRDDGIELQAFENHKISSSDGPRYV